MGSVPAITKLNILNIMNLTPILLTYLCPMALFKYFKYADALPASTPLMPSETVKEVNEEVKKKLKDGCGVLLLLWLISFPLLLITSCIKSYLICALTH